jgi:hypothetical protein
MSTSQTGNLAQDTAVNAAESARQVAVASASGSAATARSAEITFYRACLASAIANKCGTEQFIAALRALGVYS